MRALLMLSSATVVFAVLTACSSHWQQSIALDPVTVDLGAGEARIAATISLAQDGDALLCDSLYADLRLGWTGPDGIPVEVVFLDGDGEPLTESAVVDTVDGQLLANGNLPFAQLEAGLCEVVIVAVLASEAGGQGALTLEVVASDSSASGADDPDDEVALTAEIEVL